MASNSVISKVKINNVRVEPLKSTIRRDVRPVRAASMFKTPYPNIGIIAPKNSGKSVLMSSIVRAKATRQTKVFAFCATIKIDQTWIDLAKWCAQNKIQFVGRTAIKEDKKDLYLQELINSISAFEGEKELHEDSDSESEGDVHPKFTNEEKSSKFRKSTYTNQMVQPEYSSDEYDTESDVEDNFPRDEEQLTHGLPHPGVETVFPSTIKPRREHELAPKYILIFDDISQELKNPVLQSMYKKNRHMKMLTISASQYICDLKPESLQQLDYLLLFQKIDDKKLEKIYRDTNTCVPMSTFYKLYKDATREKYHFLYIDVRDNQFRKDFDTLYRIPEDQCY